MRLDHRNTRWLLAIIPLLALSFTLATLAREPALPSPSPDLSIHNCRSYPYTVICARNHNPDGVKGCFDTLCDAAAAGAYQCKRTASTCEPH